MRDPAIDYLRGVSIFLVVAMHYCYFFFGGPRFGFTAEEWGIFYRNGAYGVTIFFVLSGYLITFTSIQRFGTLRALSPKRFYFLRAARIYPPLVLLVAGLLVLHFTGLRFGTVEKPHQLADVLAHIVTNRANWYLVKHGSIGLPWDVLWSLAVEEMFYLFFPLFAAFISGRFLIGILAALVCLGPAYRTSHVLFDYFSCVDQLAIGCVVASMTAAGYFSRLSKPVRLAALISGAVVIAVTYFYKPMDHENRVWGPSLVALGAALVIVATRSPSERTTSTRVEHRSGALDWLTLGAVFRPLGRSSYELYLFHGVLMVLFVNALPWLQPFLEAGPGGLNVMLLVTYTATLTVIGFLLRAFYSEPLNRWLRGCRDGVKAGGR